MAALNRRRFLQASAGTVAVAASVEAVAKAAASERVRVGCIGAGGRALSLVTSFANNPNCEIVAIADLDSRRFGAVGSSRWRPPLNRPCVKHQYRARPRSLRANFALSNASWLAYVLTAMAPT